MNNKELKPNLTDFPIDMIREIASHLDTPKDISSFQGASRFFRKSLQKVYLNKIEQQFVKEIVIGNYCTYFITESGKVFGCGENRDDKFMIGHRNNCSLPKLIANLPPAISVAASKSRTQESFTIFVCENGAVYARGSNDWGQLGTDNGFHHVSKLKQVSTLPNAKVISAVAGDQHTILLCEDGSVWGCGASHTGINKSAPITKFTQIKHLPPVKQIVAAGKTAFYLCLDGSLWARGSNYLGQLGLGDIVNFSDIPTRINNLPPVKKVSITSLHTCVLCEDGSVWACGDNPAGNIGISRKLVWNWHTFTKITNLPRIRDISAGNSYTLLVCEDGDTLVLGEGNMDGVLQHYEDRYQPRKLNFPPAQKVFASNNGYSFCITEDRKIYAYGSNFYGQLGINKAVGRYEPEGIEFFNRWVDLYQLVLSHQALSNKEEDVSSRTRCGIYFSKETT